MKKEKDIPDALPEGDYLVGKSELMQFLGITAPTVRKIIKNREVPFYQIGSKFYFEKSTVSASSMKGVSNA